METLIAHSPNRVLSRVDDWTNDSFPEDVHMDIRVYEKVEQTMEVVLDGIMEGQGAFQEEGLVANVRLKTYEGEKILLKK